MSDPTDIRENEQAQAAKATEAERRAAQEVEDFKWLMAHKQGRRIVNQLLGDSGMFRTSFSPSGSETFFKEGQRNQGLRLFARISEHCPEQLLPMLKGN
jgi:hypothetical protein